MNLERSRFQAFMAFSWLAIVLVLCIYQIQFWRGNNLDSDVMALLPNNKHDALVTRSIENIAKTATRDVVILIGSKDSEVAKSAAGIFNTHVKKTNGMLRLQEISEQDTDAALDFYSRYRDRVLTTPQTKALKQSTDEELLASSMQRLYGIGASGGLGSWISDPLALNADWWQARLGEGMLQEDGFLLTQSRNNAWVVLQYETEFSAFQLDGVDHIQQLIEAAGSIARNQHPEIEILNAGVPLHAEAAAVRANWEINTIGTSSMAAVMVLVFFAFMKFRPLFMVSGSILIGLAAGISVTALIFGKVHLMTLVFGASLVGVAEDYGIHYFSSRQGNPNTKPFTLMRTLMPGMLLAFITSALAYLVLGMAPLPGLQQMAVFSASGLLAAFLTVVCWFPFLDRQAPKQSWLSEIISNSLNSWPRWNWKKSSHLSLAVFFLLFVCFGLTKIQTEDSLRQLQSSPAQLVEQQKVVSEILGLPSPAQFVLVTASSEEALLQTEESLKPLLDNLANEKIIKSYSAISDWVPSKKRQLENQAMISAAEHKVLAGLSTTLGEQLERQDTEAAPFTFKQWMSLKATQSMQAQYLGEADGKWGSVVMINGLNSHHALTQLTQAIASVKGVRMIDRSGDVTNLLKHYRNKMTIFLCIAYLLVAFALFYRYKKHAWRALLPTVIAALASLSASAWLGEPVQLFTILAHFLILGTGVDYGIFLLEHHTDSSAWLAVCLGAASTMLAFGLLALSATPALHTFGLSLLFGIGLSWLLSPCFRLSADVDMALEK